MALLVVALAVTANKRNKSRTEKAHTDPLHCYNQTGGEESKIQEEAYEEINLETAPPGGQEEYYQELELETLNLEGRLYEMMSENNTVQY